MSDRRERHFWKPDVRRDVDDELAYHLEMREREYLARGLSPDEARAAARRKFGNPAVFAAACRDVDTRCDDEERRANMWNDLRQDVAHGIRLLGRSPGFTAVAVVTLALGIGATTAVFSVIDAALLRPLPYPNPEQLVELQVEVVSERGTQHGLAPSTEDVRAWREHRDVFSHIAVWRQVIQPVVVDGPEPERVPVMEISEDYLGLYGVTPLVGRGFDAGDSRPGAAPVVLLGHDYWQRRFGGDPGVAGRTVRLDGAPVTIVGVLPSSFSRDTPIWRPLQLSGIMAGRRGVGTTVYGRLQAGMSAGRAQQRLTQVLDPAPSLLGIPSGVRALSLYDRATADYWFTAKLLTASVAAILLIACINLAGLLLARGVARSPELAVRASLGAGRGRLVRQMLAESLVLALSAAACGLLLAWLSLGTIVANLPFSLPADSPATVNLRVLLFTLGVAVITAVVFGLLPAFRLSRSSLGAVLSHAGQRHGAPLSRGGGRALIAAEVALAIVLLAGAGLMMRSFSRILAVDLGFDPSRVIAMEAAPVDQRPEVLRQYYPALLDVLRDRPGIEAAGAVDHLPLGGSSTGIAARIGGNSIGLSVRDYEPGYFEAVGFTLLEGRFPTRADLATGPLPAVLNASAARRISPEGTVLGQTLEAWKQTYRVVGVVRDVRHGGPLRETLPEAYLPNSGRWPLTVVVRSTLPRADLEAVLRDAARAPGPRVIVGEIRRASDLLGDRVATPRQRTVLLGLLGGLGLVLTLVGIFGTTAYAVGRRTQEIGVRMALGARPQQVVTAMMRDAMWPALTGIVLGLGAAALSTKVIASFLFNTEPTDPGTFAVVALVMALAAALAAWIPARRAARVDPVDALRVG